MWRKLGYSATSPVFRGWTVAEPLPNRPSNQRRVPDQLLDLSGRLPSDTRWLGANPGTLLSSSRTTLNTEEARGPPRGPSRLLSLLVPTLRGPSCHLAASSRGLSGVSQWKPWAREVLRESTSRRPPQDSPVTAHSQVGIGGSCPTDLLRSPCPPWATSSMSHNSLMWQLFHPLSVSREATQTFRYEAGC